MTFSLLREIKLTNFQALYACYLKEVPRREQLFNIYTKEMQTWICSQKTSDFKALLHMCSLMRDLGF